MTKSMFRVLGLVASMVVGGAAVAQSTAGAVAVWGNCNGQCGVPTNLGPCIDISGSATTAVAIKSDGSVVGWGGYRTDGLPVDLGPCIKVAAGGRVTAAIKQDGTVAVWGFDENSQYAVPSDLGTCTQLCATSDFTDSRIAAIQTNGTVRIWGKGSWASLSVPASLGACSRISIKGCTNPWGDYNVALTQGGDVVAWGTYNGSYGNTGSPLYVPADLGACSEIAAGATFVLALRTDGLVRAWGDSQFFSSALEVPADLGQCLQISASQKVAMALRLDGTVRTWAGTGVPPNLGSCVRILAADSDYCMAITGDNETDHDHDGVDDANDNCPLTFNPSQSDCDHDGLGDACELDCNHNGLADVCEILSGLVTDINGNYIPDSCDVVSGLLNDYNHNGIADSAELIMVTAQLATVTAQLQCGDLDGSGDVGSEDLGMLLLNYGPCEGASLTTPQEQEPMIFQTTQTLNPVLNKK